MASTHSPGADNATIEPGLFWTGVLSLIGGLAPEWTTRTSRERHGNAGAVYLALPLAGVAVCLYTAEEGLRRRGEPAA